MGMPHGRILVQSISNANNPLAEAPLAGPDGQLGRLALENDVNNIIISQLEEGVDQTSSPIVIDEIDISGPSNGANWTIVIETSNQNNMRISNVLAVWNDSGSQLKASETSTTDIGNTDDLTLNVILSGTTIQLIANIVGPDTWNIRSKRISL